MRETQNADCARTIKGSTYEDMKEAEVDTKVVAEKTELDFGGDLVRFIIIIGLVVLAVIFLLKGMEVNPLDLTGTAINKLLKEDK